MIAEAQDSSLEKALIHKFRAFFITAAARP